MSPRASGARPVASQLLAVAFGAAVVAAAMSGSAQALASLPHGRVVDAVYCDRHNGRCEDVFGSRARPVKHAPHGYNAKLRCSWFDVGYSKSLAVDKHFCVKTRR